MPSVMILESFGYAAATAEGMFAARFAINFAVSTLVSRAFSAQPGMTQTSDSGVRQQVPPSNTNSIPVVYGNAYVGGTFVDAVLSTDQQTMYYVMALSHAIEGGAHSYDLTKMYYGDQLITFNTPTPEQTDVISLTDTAGNVDTKIAGNLSIYLYYANEAGTITGYNTNYLPSSTNVMGSTGIDASLRWPSSGRQMNGLMFAIVKLKYNRDAGTTSLSPITFNITNNTYNGYVPNRAGDVWYDYMTNTKYGAAMDPSIVDTVSRDALNAYAQATIPYTPSGGGSATQARYKINGVIDTSKDCLSNIDQIMLACDSWNQYNATTGKWSIVINKAESTTFAFDDSNIVGDIRISAQDINQSINQIEAQFPNNSNKDQQDFVYIQTPSNLLYVNEPVNKYTIKYELVNNSVQAQYLANRQLEQAREDLIVTINTPYPGIQVDAGDVVSITNAFYGWNAKLFRVMKVVESATPEGGLGAALDLTEYNAQVYDNASITAFTPAPNSGLSNPNYFYPSPLTAPYVSASNLSVTVPNFSIVVTMPSVGRVTGVTLYYRVNGSGSDWKVWLTQLSAGSTPFTPSSTFVFKDVVLPTAAYDFSYTVFNDIGGSAISSVLSNYSWSPYPAKIGTNLVSATNVVQTAIDVNNQYGGVPVTNYIGNWQQTVPNGVGLNLQSPSGDSLPLRLFAGSGGVTPVTVYPHMALIPLTAGLPTSSIDGGVTFMGGHLYTNNGSAWNKVYQEGDGGLGDVTGPSGATNNAIARFSGTTGKLIQNSVITIDNSGNTAGTLSQQFSDGSATTLAAGKMWYNGTTGSLNFGMGGGNITQQVGEELFVYGKASAAITDSPLQIIYQTGTVGASGVIKFAPTIAGITDGDLIIGVATESIALNGFGRITSFGVIHNITTNGTAYGETWADGDVIWYNPVTGNPTKVKPVAPNIKVQVGIVISAGSGGSGSFQVEINHGSVLGGTDANVQFASLATNNLIQYNGTYWSNVTPASITGIGSAVYAGYLNNGSSYLLQAYSETTGLLLNGWDILAPAASSTALRFSNVSNGILGHILYDASGAGFKFYDAATGYTPITASVITGTRLASTVATGTAPLTVSSTTRVSNLNVATAGTADALLNGNRQAVAGTYAWDSWNFYSNSSTLSSINLLTSTGTWLAQLYADGVSTGFLASYGAGTFDLEKVINGDLYIRIGGIARTVFNTGSVIPIANGGTNGTATPTAGGIAYGTGTSYAFTGAGTAGQVLKSNGAGAPTWSAASTGTVTSVSVANANGFSGTVANASTTPAITLTTTVTGILKGNGTSMSAAVAGDFPTLNQNTTGYAAYLNNGSNYQIQAYSESSGLLQNGWDISAPLASSTSLRFSNVTSGILGHILNDGTGFKFYNATTGYTPITADSLTVSNNATAAKFVTSSTASEVFYGNTSNSTPTINLYTSGTVNGYFSATSTGNLNLWNSRTGTGLLLSAGGGVNGLQFYAGGVYNIVLNAGNYNSYALPLSGGTLSGALNVGAAIGSSRGTSLSVSGSNSSSPFAAKSGTYSTVFAVLPWASGTTYISSGIYYDSSSWVHASDNTYNSLFTMSGTAGATWYASNNSTGSWNLANAVALWDNTGRWNGAINTSQNANFVSTITANEINSNNGYSFIANGYNNNGGLALNNASTYWGLVYNYSTNNWRLGYGNKASQVGWNLSWDNAGNVNVNSALGVGGNATIGGQLYVSGSKFYTASNASGQSFELYITAGSGANPWRHIYGGTGTGFGVGVGGYGIYYDGNSSYNIICKPSGTVTFPYSTFLGENGPTAGKVNIAAGGAGGVGWSTGLNIGDSSNYTGFIQDGGVSRWRNFGTGGYDWYGSGGSRLMALTNGGNLIVTGGLGTGGATPAGFFGAANPVKFYNSGGNAEVLISAGSGAAILEFDASSGSDWHLQNSGGIFYFTQTSVADRMYINGAAVTIPGSLSKGSGTFDIPHPSVEGKRLRHSFVEGPRVDLIYRGHVTLVNGTATLNMDTDAVSEGGQTMTTGTFVALTRDADIFVQNLTGWEPLKASIDGATLTITCKDNTSSDTVSWMVVAERKDRHLHDADIVMTDDQGRMILEYVGEPLHQSGNI